MATVSVIIPTYNRADFLKEAVDSVLTQTFHDVELIVVDDGSTDHTRQLLQSYGQQLRSVTQENRGVSSARNIGIHASTGEYIALLDSDDLWLPNKLEQQVTVMEQQPDLQLCHTEEIWIRRGKRVNPKKKHQKHGGYIFPYCLPLCVISPSSVMMRRTLFEEVGMFDEALPACEDYDLWLRITKTYPVHFIETPLLVKRGGHADQLSRAIWGLDRFRIQALEKLLQAGELNAEQRRQTCEELRLKCKIMAAGSLKRQNQQAWEYYRQLPRTYC